MSFAKDVFSNFQAYNKFWCLLIMMIVSVMVQQGCIAPNSINEKDVSGFLFAIAPFIALIVPNRKKLESGETVNVQDIKEVVATKVEQAVERVEGK